MDHPGYTHSAAVPCEAKLTGINTRRLATSGTPISRFGKRYIYACSSCDKTLGISHRKGFWMG